jgi:hypothetical protein
MDDQDKRKAMPEIKHQVTTGNALQIGAMLVAIAIGWGALNERATASNAELSDHEQRIRALEVTILTKLGSVDGQLAVISRELNEIQKQLPRRGE